MNPNTSPTDGSTGAQSAPQPADVVVNRIRAVAAGWERDACLYPDASLGLAEIAFILRTALEPVDGPVTPTGDVPPALRGPNWKADT
jgi:hypothetical protein